MINHCSTSIHRFVCPSLEQLLKLVRMVGVSFNFCKNGLDVSVNVSVGFSTEHDGGATSRWQVFLKAVCNLGVVGIHQLSNLCSA